MKKYNYIETMKEDVREYIDNEIDFADFDELEGLEDHLRDMLFVSDITGNASGSYTCNRCKAKEYVLKNTDLLQEACTEFDCKEQFAEKFFEDDWEWMDVTIRCYLLGQAIFEALEEIEEEFEEAHKTV